MCRAYHGHEKDSERKAEALKRLKASLQHGIMGLTDRIARLQNQAASPGRNGCLEDYREMLAAEQTQLKQVQAMLGEELELGTLDLRNQRIQCGLTQAEFAEKLGISREHLNRMEKGKIEIGPRTVSKLKKVTFPGG